MFFTNFRECQSNKYLKRNLKDEKLIEIYKKLCKFKIQKRYRIETVAFILKCERDEMIKILEILKYYGFGIFNYEKSVFMMNFPDDGYIEKTKRKTKTPWARYNKLFARGNQSYCFY